jgi:hypothetical protein
VEFKDAGHNSFTDSCVGIRSEGGLSKLVALIGEQLVKLGEDGCTDAYIDPKLVEPAAAHYTIAFLESVFKPGSIDPTALGKDAVAGIAGLALSDYQAA